MNESFQRWTPDFADQISDELNLEEPAETGGQDKTAVPSGRKRVGPNHDGLCRRAPVHCTRR